MISPLGRYSEISATVTAIALVLAAVAAHLGLVTVADFAWLDASAGIAVGVVLGQRASTNGAGKLALAAHARLDALNAPPAADGAGAEHS